MTVDAVQSAAAAVTAGSGALKAPGKGEPDPKNPAKPDGPVAAQSAENQDTRAIAPGEETSENPSQQRLADETLQALIEEQSREELSVEGLTPEEEEQVEDLKQQDREVRAHEQAHKTVGGPYTGSIQYSTVTGPDGREYAVSGEVAIDTSPVSGNPEATIRKMDVVIRAALAPAEPSPQDIQVARAAQQQKIQARQELREEKASESGDSGNGNDAADSSTNENYLQQGGQISYKQPPETEGAQSQHF